MTLSPVDETWGVSSSLSKKLQGLLFIATGLTTTLGYTGGATANGDSTIGYYTGQDGYFIGQSKNDATELASLGASSK